MIEHKLVINDTRNIHIKKGIFTLSIHICMCSSRYEIAILDVNDIYVYNKELELEELIVEIEEFLRNPNKFFVKVKEVKNGR